MATIAGTIQRPFGGLTYSNVGALQLDATDQRNLFTIVPSATTADTINGWGPTATGLSGGNVPTVPAMSLTVDFTGTLGSTMMSTAVPAGGNSFNGALDFQQSQGGELQQH